MDSFSRSRTRDPLEVESAKARGFVLIPIEKLKVSRHRHDGTQMTSFTGDQCHTDTNHCDGDVTPILRGEYRKTARTNSSYLREVGPGS
jgi:hypothetical protein